uniref:Uncharacterized protein n=1 Tax=Amphimedon queenslandica TaxID=400682 RepID=A0A1X7UCR9_AMPQE
MDPLVPLGGLGVVIDSTHDVKGSGIRGSCRGRLQTDQWTRVLSIFRG